MQQDGPAIEGYLGRWESPPRYGLTNEASDEKSRQSSAAGIAFRPRSRVPLKTQNVVIHQTEKCETRKK